MLETIPEIFAATTSGVLSAESAEEAFTCKTCYWFAIQAHCVVLRYSLKCFGETVDSLEGRGGVRGFCSVAFSYLSNDFCFTFDFRINRHGLLHQFVADSAKCSDLRLGNG